MEYRPLSSVMIRRSTLVSTLCTVILAFATTAPLGSITVPTRPASWAHRNETARRKNAQAIRRIMAMTSSTPNRLDIQVQSGPVQYLEAKSAKPYPRRLARNRTFPHRYLGYFAGYRLHPDHR